MEGGFFWKKKEKKEWYLPYFEGVYHTQIIETFSHANAHMVRMVHNHTMLHMKVQHFSHTKVYGL